MTEAFFPRLMDPNDDESIRVGDDALTYRELAGAAAAVASELRGAGRVAVWAQPALEAVAAIVGALAAGVAVVPLNPGLGSRELEHIVTDSRPERLLAWPGVQAPEQLSGMPRFDVDLNRLGARDAAVHLPGGRQRGAGLAGGDHAHVQPER